MIGASRQTVSSILSSLKRKGVLRIENHRIHIQAPDILETMYEATSDNIINLK